MCIKFTQAEESYKTRADILESLRQEASGNICNCSSTVNFQSMSEHKRRIKFLTLPPPPPPCRDDTANRIKWVTGLYDHYIKVVHMQNPQNMEKKIIKEVAPSVCGEKNNSWCKELQDASLPSDKMGNDRKQLFTLLTAKETYSPCSRVWKPPDAALFSHFHIFVHATSESFSIFTEGGEESTKPSNVYIFFFLVRGCWMNFNHDHKKKEKEKSAVFDVRNLWNFLFLRRNCNVWPL